MLSKKLFNSFKKILKLGANWDFYNARAIQEECVKFGVGLLTEIMDEDTPEPSIVPTVNGSIQFEWHIHKVDLEVEIISPNTYVIYFEDLKSGENWRYETGGAQSLKSLKRLVKLITDRGKDRIE